LATRQELLWGDRYQHFRKSRTDSEPIRNETGRRQPAICKA
jgi:hypothetical protein